MLLHLRALLLAVTGLAVLAVPATTVAVDGPLTAADTGPGASSAQASARSSAQSARSSSTESVVEVEVADHEDGRHDTRHVEHGLPAGAATLRTGAFSAPTALSGSRSDWTYLLRGGGRWDPCQRIRWAYNARGGYPGSLKHWKRAVRRVARRTGLRFRYVGRTSYVHHTGMSFPRGVDLGVAWSTARKVEQLRGGVLGVGGGRATMTNARDVDWRFVSGYVVLDRAHRLRRGFASSGSGTWGQVMQHELLHALGLGHARAESQLMHGRLTSGNHRFGRGDRTGMKRIGARMGCLS